MTEDDTFRILSRTPKSEMNKLWLDWAYSPDSLEEWHRTLRDNKWTKIEWTHEIEKSLSVLSNHPTI